MGFFSRLFRGKKVSDASVSSPHPAPTHDAEASSDAATDLINAVTEKLKDAPGGANIWDYADGGSETALDLSEIDAAPGGAAAVRARRNKTRMIGFETDDGDALGLFKDDAEIAADALAVDPELTVGWLVVIDGRGRGTSLTLKPGASTIGRGDAQSVVLDFGDETISGGAHATITHDLQMQAFTLTVSPTASPVQHNGTVLGSEAVLKTGDRIRIGATELCFVAFADAVYTWPLGSATSSEESEDVATL